MKTAKELLNFENREKNCLKWKTGVELIKKIQIFEKDSFEQKHTYHSRPIDNNDQDFCTFLLDFHPKSDIHPANCCQSKKYIITKFG